MLRKRDSAQSAMVAESLNYYNALLQCAYRLNFGTQVNYSESTVRHLASEMRDPYPDLTASIPGSRGCSDP